MSSKYWADKVDSQDTIHADDFNTAFDGISEDIETEKDRADGMATDLQSLQGDVESLQGDVGTLQGNVSTLSSSVNDLSSDVTLIGGLVTNLERNVSDLQGNVSTLSGSVNDLSTDVSTIGMLLTNVEGNVSTLQGDVADLHNTAVPGGYVDLTEYGLEETATENVYFARYNAEDVDEQGKTVYSFCQAGDEIEISNVDGIGYDFYINREYVRIEGGDTWTGTLTEPVTLKIQYLGAVELSVFIPGADGLMSKEDKAKLDGIESGATKTIIDSALSASSENPVQNRVVNGAIDGLNQSISDIGDDVSALGEEVDDLGDEVDGIGNQVSDIDTALDDILTIQHTLIGGRPVTWADIRSAIRDGKAEQYFSIGDQLTVQLVPNITCSIGDSTGISGASVDKSTFVVKTGWAHAGTYSFIYGGKSWRSDNGKVVDLIDYGITVTGSPAEGDTVTITEATAGSLVFDVIGFDHDTPTNSQLTHSMTLQLHKEFDTALRFCSSEAAFYIDANTYPQGLAAGTYNFTWTYDNVSVESGTYQFTLAEDVPVGGQIVIGTNGNTTALTSCKISTYAAAGDTNAIERDAAITSGSGGTSLGTITATGVTDSVNSAQRIMYGSNRWATSGIRQWLNADGAANTWWQAKTVFDRPTNADVDGFLKDIDAAFLDIIGEVSKTTQKSGSDGYGLETTAEKFFLLSRPEVYGGTERSADGADGTVYAYYGEGHSDLPSPGTGADSNRIKYRDSSAQSWILRTPSANSIGIRYIATSGGMASGYAMTRIGIAPACVIV